MYSYVKDKMFLKNARKKCCKIMWGIVKLLRDKYKINSQFILVGSGGRNMITQNQQDPIDFDYNLNIIAHKNINNKEIKESIRKAANEILKENGLDDIEDSKSSLTTKKIQDLVNQYKKTFYIDICIVKKQVMTNEID